MAVRELTGKEVADALTAALPDVVEGFDEGAAWVRPARINSAATFLRDDPPWIFSSSIPSAQWIMSSTLTWCFT